MSLKLTAFLGVLLIVLLGFLFFYEQPRMEAEREAANAEEAFIDVARQSVSKLTLINEFGRFVAEKRNGEWTLIEPVETPGNWAALEDLVSYAKAVERGRVVVDSAAYVSGKVDLSAFGLAPPRVEVRFVSQSGGEIGLFFGDDNPTGRAAYLAWSGGNKVVLTHRYQRNKFEQGLLELRDTRALPFDPDRVYTIEIQTPSHTIVVNRSEFAWELLAPIRDRADDATVNGLLSDLKAEYIVDVIDERAEDLSAYGLDSPAYRVVLTGRDSTQRHALLLGDAMPGDKQGLRYGRCLSRPYVFVVERFLLETVFSKSPSELRYRRVFEFDRAGIDRIQLTYPDSNIVCQKNSNGEWMVRTPEGHRVSARQVEDWIDSVHSLRAESFEQRRGGLGDFGLDAPSLVVSLWKGETLIREVTIGKRDRRWFGKRRDSDEVVGVPQNIMKGLQLKLAPASQSRNQETTTGA